MPEESFRPNYVLSGASIQELAAGTARLLHSMGTIQAFHFADPDTAPTVSVAADDTVYSFSILDGTHDLVTEFPHMVMKNFDQLRIIATFAMQIPMTGMQWRVQVDDLLSPSSADSSAYVPMGQGFTAPSEWARRGYLINSSAAALSVTAPSNQLVKVTLQAKYLPTVTSQGAAVTRTVKLQSLLIEDWISSSTLWEE